MAMFGKTLVVVHAAASVGVLAWAIGVYSQRIQWNTVAKSTTPGVLDQLKEKIEEGVRGSERAYTRWSGNLATVRALEGERYPRRAFYAGQLEMVQFGTFGGQPVNGPPVQVLENAPNNYLDITKPQGRKPVEVREGIPTDSQAGYLRRIQQTLLDIDATQKRSAKAVQDRDLLNREIVGVTAPMRIKGLRQLITEQKQIEERADQENQYVSGFLTNREAEFGLYRKRRDSMTMRISELSGRN